MNWVIHKSEKIRYHTYLDEILQPVIGYVQDFSWLLSDLDIGPSVSKLPINRTDEHFKLSAAEFKILLQTDLQISWGSILGFPSSAHIQFDLNNLPYVRGNDLIFENGNIQHPNAQIEIDCFDNSFTIVKFKSEELSKKFRAYFPEAVELAKFK